MPTLKLLQITIFLALFSSLIQADEKPSRKLDENPPDLENKCGNCPCDRPCKPPRPSPPPPSPPPPSPPPPPPRPRPPRNICPPPPAEPDEQTPPERPNPPDGQTPPTRPYPPSIYLTGPPGSVYSVNQYNSGGCRSFLVGKVPFLIVSCLLWAVTF
ncbi:sulfated surface glycoprotein 185-like protein [Salvia divinorum]|uniref:Sulfated surface glycoprotein 185-like protein n=1 Tax=Salvia divinorum TaxID=28513 RepID=A0ABD1HBW1_SALDI